MVVIEGVTVSGLVVDAFVKDPVELVFDVHCIVLPEEAWVTFAVKVTEAPV
jgi:hypothetical protein